MVFLPRLLADLSFPFRRTGLGAPACLRVPTREAFCQADHVGPAFRARFSAGKEGHASTSAGKDLGSKALAFCRESAPWNFARNRGLLGSGSAGNGLSRLVTGRATGAVAKALSCLHQQPRHFTGPHGTHSGAPSDKPNEAGKKRGPTGLQRPCDLTGPLATFMGKTEASRVEVVKHIWDYIKRHNLQSPENKRMINADSTLRPLFQKDQVSMFELNKLVSKFVQSRPSPPKP
ncbi:hypothetical protein NCLIV_033810 [Neospora caninum Liverpool]|uniref:DNA topoisomerase domain-containing protein n=1 Tax=Neospora caninum (strain Liverpool) TaxID=572307 RepID=F0VIN3_NEOCL|nr:hypothetical protein NCLIV_033810 [Neospora caninum Liverpool]CBZ53594.1 hypothetical protein NCLIV_033810 [Neospora caninum Liverpool]CEL67584.1 TPA: DNA topoisomerase domain-containing protein [Neospora caninum Liverpool]|eukprot:XP_003883626.1 hypothetical protein NCLIV_033810 [Neospora caninum Liverpool]